MREFRAARARATAAAGARRARDARRSRTRPSISRTWTRPSCFTIFTGCGPSSRRREDCDVAMSSDSLRYAFQHMWGGESLQVNGRFRELRPDGRLALFQYFWLAAGRNRGEAIGWGDLLRRWLAARRLVGRALGRESGC